MSPSLMSMIHRRRAAATAPSPASAVAAQLVGGRTHLPEERLEVVVDHLARCGRADGFVALVWENLAPFSQREVAASAQFLRSEAPTEAAQLQRLSQAPWLRDATTQRWGNRFIQAWRRPRGDSKSLKKSAEARIHALCETIRIGCRLPGLTTGAQAALLGSLVGSGPAVTLYSCISADVSLVTQLPFARCWQQVGDVSGALAIAWTQVPGYTAVRSVALRKWLVDEASRHPPTMASFMASRSAVAALRGGGVPWLDWMAHFMPLWEACPEARGVFDQLCAHHPPLQALVLTTWMALPRHPASMCPFVQQWEMLAPEVLATCTSLMLADTATRRSLPIESTWRMPGRSMPRHRLTVAFALLPILDENAATIFDDLSQKGWASAPYIAATPLRLTCLIQLVWAIKHHRATPQRLVELLATFELAELEGLNKLDQTLLTDLRAMVASLDHHDVPLALRLLTGHTSGAIVAVDSEEHGSHLIGRMADEMERCLKSAQSNVDKLVQVRTMLGQPGWRTPLQVAIATRSERLLWRLYAIKQQHPLVPLNSGMPLLDACSLPLAAARTYFGECRRHGAQPLHAAHATALHDHASPQLNMTWRNLVSDMSMAAGYQVVGTMLSCPECAMRLRQQLGRAAWFADEEFSDHVVARFDALARLSRAVVDDRKAKTLLVHGSRAQKSAAVEVLLRCPQLLQHMVEEYGETDQEGPTNANNFGLGNMLTSLLVGHCDVLDRSRRLEEEVCAFSEDLDSQYDGIRWQTQITHYVRENAQIWGLQSASVCTNNDAFMASRRALHTLESPQELDKAVRRIASDVGRLHRRGLLLSPMDGAYNAQGLGQLAAFRTLSYFCNDATVRQHQPQLADNPRRLWAWRTQDFLQRMCSDLRACHGILTSAAQGAQLQTCIAVFMQASTGWPEPYCIAFLKALVPDWGHVMNLPPDKNDALHTCSQWLAVIV